jgi:tetratricopeptide (TPR) repeat protein
LAAQAIAADPNRAGAWALRGQVLQARGQFDEALASYHKALSLQTPLPDVQVAIAEIYSATQRPQRALATLQTLAASFPPGQVPLEIVVRQSQTLISLGRAQDAAQCLLAACQRTSPSADLLLELARAQHLAQDRAAARQTLAAALARQPQHPGCLALAHELGAVEPAMAAVEPSAKRR